MSAPTPQKVGPDGLPRYFWAGRWWRYDYARVVPRLGKVSDTALAIEIGCGVDSLGKFRRRWFAIPRHVKLACVDPYLGRIPDAVLARHFGVAKNSVWLRRKRLGIPAASVKKSNADAALRAYLRALEGG